MKSKKLLLFMVVVLSFSTALTASAQSTNKTDQNSPNEDVILQWNRVLGQTLQIPNAQSPTIMPLRSFAMMHLAMFDAVNSIDRTYTPYLTDVGGKPYASVRAAAAQAAYDVLVGLYPDQQSIFAAELAQSLNGIPFFQVTRGRAIGHIVAQRMLANRAGDGWSAPWKPYLLPPTPGNWQELFPGPYPGFAVFTNFPGVTPFALTQSTQFLPAPPPALSSAEYAASLNEVKALGAANSTTRTADQTLTAFLWANPPVSDGLMFNVVRSTALARNNSTVENARLFALIFMAYHDALETTFTSQYTYGLWRPVTAIRRADEDGNPNTAPDANWESLLGPQGTPPHPSYASNASSASASLATILALFYQRDDIQFQINFGGTPNLIRNYRSFSALTNEVARSRVYGGVHFPTDIDAGQSAGRSVANYVFLNYLTPRRCNLH
ncbi:MAG: vanadium-dependent haloperoxidase [Acidobacteria bacterium]|nr:vanadium-dependent haloperoxidase [Acidobacteriota bacterium]MCA1637996.1 vanadium-dependent haloperoxidase [Acidobacteriota bacterium]